MGYSTKKRVIQPRRCTYCGAEAPVVWVHGHGQCAKCGINVEECCRGEQCTSTHTGNKKKKSIS